MSSPRRRRGVSPFDRAALGTYRGPAITPRIPKLTIHRVRLLQAIAEHEIKRGQGSFAGHWRWSGVTVTNTVAPLVACGWVHEIGSHLELTDAGWKALETGPRQVQCPVCGRDVSILSDGYIGHAGRPHRDPATGQTCKGHGTRPETQRREEK